MVKSDFIWAGGAPWLDFINTEVIAGGTRLDLLANSEALWVWLTASEIVPPEVASVERSGEENQALFESAKKLRALLRGLCEGFGENGVLAPELVEQLNDYLGSPAPGGRLQWNAAGELELVTDWSEAGPHYLLLPLAQTAAKTLSGGDLSRLRKCASEQCILWFLDTSKNGQRRWCSMEICGNRHKVSQHNLRKKS